MKRLFLLILFLVLTAVGISFAIHNGETVTLRYFFGTYTGPLSLVVAIALAAGAVLGAGASLLLVFTQRRKVSRLQRKLDVCEQEIRNLRHLPLRDNH